MPPRKSTSGPTRQARSSLSGTGANKLMPPPVTPSSSAPSRSSATAPGTGAVARSRGQPATVTRGKEVPIASSSRVTLDAIPPLILPETLTPGYAPSQGPARGLDEEQRGRMIHELIGFHPQELCYKITDEARGGVFDVTMALDGHLANLVRSLRPECQREVDIGLFALETLLSNHVDKAFDKFTAWALRNTFDVPDDIEVVLPWCKGLDFERGAYVASLPGGEDAIVNGLEDLRKKVEQARYLSQQLESAERTLDRRLEIARQRKAEVGFVQEVLAGANRMPPSPRPSSSPSSLAPKASYRGTRSHPVNPLAPTLRSAKTTLNALHELVEGMPDPAPPSHTAAPAASQGQGQGHGQGQKAWEMGRQAYLAWAVGKAVATANANAVAAGGAALDVSVVGAGMGVGAGADADALHTLGAGAGGGSLEDVERDLGAVGAPEDVERALKGLQ